MLKLVIEGLFYVIDGFLDVILPTDKPSSADEKPTKPSKSKQSSTTTHDRDHSAHSQFPSVSSMRGVFTEASTQRNKDRSQKPLFTVKPGGIAGYLCTFLGSTFSPLH